MPSINNQHSTIDNPKILVVDDDRSMRKSLKLLLKCKGYRVDCAESAAVALELMAKGPYDTVISDIVMTEMDGIELLENILEKHPILPVILISGYASIDTVIDALRLGAFDYLKKPVDSNEILFRVRNALEVKRLRQEKERDRREKEELLDEVSRQNGNLEIMVRERTMSLEASEQELENSIAKLREEHRQRLLLSKQLIELLERERGQWAMDIHDHIGQSLASIKMGIERLLQQVGKSDTALSDKISVLRDGTVNLMRCVRDFSHWLRPSTLDKLGLVPTLNQLFDDIKKESGLEIHFFTAKMPQKFDEEKEVACFRIVQEALNNTIKHAEAKKVYVNLINKGKVVSIGVEDEGVGFDPVKVDKKPGGKGRLGILIMEERAVQLGGTFSLESRIGGGTQIFVEIPV